MENEKWTLNDTFLLIHILLFYVVIVGGLIATIFSATKKLPFPVWGVVIVWVASATLVVSSMLAYLKIDQQKKG